MNKIFCWNLNIANYILYLSRPAVAARWCVATTHGRLAPARKFRAGVACPFVAKYISNGGWLPLPLYRRNSRPGDYDMYFIRSPLMTSDYRRLSIAKISILQGRMILLVDIFAIVRRRSG